LLLMEWGGRGAVWELGKQELRLKKKGDHKYKSN